MYRDGIIKRLAMKNRIQLVVNAGSSADTTRPAANAPPHITGARKSFIIGSFALNWDIRDGVEVLLMKIPYV
jgi:hypothetical protein